MFISIFRAGLTAVVGVLVVMALRAVLVHMTPLLGEDNMMANAVTSLESNVVLVVIMAVAVGLLYRAVIESEVGR